MNPPLLNGTYLKNLIDFCFFRLYYIDLVVSYVFYIALIWALFIFSEPLATAAEIALSTVFRTLLALPGVRMIGSTEEVGEEILSRS